MNWEAIGAVGEVVGAAGVVITLIYLATQIRQNTRAIRLSTLHSTTEGFRSEAALVGAAGEVAGVYACGLANPGELNLPERVQFYALMHNQTRCYEDAYYQHTEGVLDERYWSGMHGQMLNTASFAGFAQYWRDRRQWYSESFQQHVDKVLLIEGQEITLGGNSGD